MACAEVMLMRGNIFDHEYFAKLMNKTYEYNYQIVNDLVKIFGKRNCGLEYSSQIDGCHELCYSIFYVMVPYRDYTMNRDVEEITQEKIQKVFSTDQDEYVEDRVNAIVQGIADHIGKTFDECRKLFRERTATFSILYDVDNGNNLI